MAISAIKTHSPVPMSAYAHHGRDRLLNIRPSTSAASVVSSSRFMMWMLKGTMFNPTAAALRLHRRRMHLEGVRAGVNHHFVMHTLEQHALDGADHLPDVLADEHDVLRADDDVHRRVLAEAEVHARESVPANSTSSS